jgi:hypothetical protein
MADDRDGIRPRCLRIGIGECTSGRDARADDREIVAGDEGDPRGTYVVVVRAAPDRDGRAVGEMHCRKVGCAGESLAKVAIGSKHECGA